MHRITIEVVTSGERASVEIDVSRAYNLAFAVRDKERMDRHLEELRAEGVEVPLHGDPPAIFPISPWVVQTSAEATVQFDGTSGEVEIVVIDIADEDSFLVGVGSDHTDRNLERHGVLWSKQVAPNILAPVVWRWEEVADHWDDVVLRSFVGNPSELMLYQEARGGDFLRPPEMLEILDKRVAPVPGNKVVFGGTIDALAATIEYGAYWKIELHDPILDRRIEHGYTVTVLYNELAT